MKTEKWKRGNRIPILSFYFLLLTSYFLLHSCSYHMVGSKPLPFKSVTIKHIHNKTYEPRLEERLHNAFSREFVSEGIRVMAANGDITLEATITTFEVGAIAIIGEEVQEQSMKMEVDVKVIDKDRMIELTSMGSPIKITFQSPGAVTDSVIQKEKAIDKACKEIAREIIGKIILQYVK